MRMGSGCPPACPSLEETASGLEASERQPLMRDSRAEPEAVQESALVQAADSAAPVVEVREAEAAEEEEEEEEEAVAEDGAGAAAEETPASSPASATGGELNLPTPARSRSRCRTLS